jgi:acetyl esterase
LPIHPAIASNFHLLDGIDSFEAGLADPVTRARLDEFMSHRGAPPPPAVDVSPGSAPGPHRPVPLLIYRPE